MSCRSARLSPPSCPCSRARHSLMSRSFPALDPRQNQSEGSARLSWTVRCSQAALGCALVALLGLAVWLKPDPSGRGTHRQLGLPPCTFVMFFDQPCPSCGMTTSWAHVVRGQIVSALRANVGGALLAALAIVATPWSLISAGRGRWAWGPPRERTVVTVATVLVLVTIVDWMARIGWN